MKNTLHSILYKLNQFLLSLQEFMEIVHNSVAAEVLFQKSIISFHSLPLNVFDSQAVSLPRNYYIDAE